MDYNTKIQLLKTIDFGDIDGYGDPNLDKYFLDKDYWNKIVNNKTYFVIGKKGTGKSSIYRMIYEQGISKGAFIENKDFGEFPFEKLLLLSDDSFSKPNQYQSIWKNVILNIFAKMITNSCIPEDCTNIYYEQIKNYFNTCVGDIVDLHKEILNRTTKSKAGLTFHFFSADVEKENQFSIGSGTNNLSQINSELLTLITNYLVTSISPKKYIIQFDRLDDNYNQYQNKEEYYHAIISLFKTVYKINQDFRSRKIDSAKIIVYLRSDILKELGKRDSESARWDDFCLNINWAIINRDDWINPPLLQMINKRIKVSTNLAINFKEIFDSKEINLQNRHRKQLDTFKYIIDQTMHRPRDLIKFCKCIQEEVIDSNKLYFRTIKNAEKKYAYWLLNSEIANEINPIIQNLDSVYELLKLVGSKPFSLTDLNNRYKAFQDIELSSEDLAFYLYDVGVFLNIDTSKRPPEIRSIIRNEGKLDRNKKIIIHPGIWNGLNY